MKIAILAGGVRTRLAEKAGSAPETMIAIWRQADRLADHDASPFLRDERI
jgi:hypothetical protein